jgi:hypothetical protein
MAIGKTLTVYLAADVSKLRSGLNSADRSLSGFSKSLSSMVGPALIGATAAAGAFAVSLAVDGVQAAIQEEAELAKLSKTLDNLGFGAQTDEVNGFIDSLQYASATSDSTLRPAFSRLLTATNDVAQAQSLLQLALDVSAGTGKSLETVTNALGKAYDGNLGALGKLGAGIDSSTIKSKDLDGAIDQLGKTFGGQSATAAATLGGQITTLGIAFDELKESFGTGFLKGMAQSAGGIGNMTQTMRDLQPEVGLVGEFFGELGVKLLETGAFFAKLDREIKSRFNETIARSVNGLIQLGDILGIVSDEEAAKADADFELYKSSGYATQGTNALTGALVDQQAALERLALYSGRKGNFGMGVPFKALADGFESLTPVIDPVIPKVTGLGKAVEKMNPRLRAQIDLVKTLTSQLDDAGKALVSARKDMDDWIDSMAGQITSGIDLGAVYDAAFDDAGKSTGQSLLEGFNKQIQQAGIFGDYLKKLNSEGGPELRDAVAALGPEAGNKLAEQIIKDGLIPTMQSQLVAVKQQAQTTAEAMTPEFLVAGVNSAVNFLIGTQNALSAATSQLEEMGRVMGKTIGDAAAEEIRAALAAAGVAMSGGNATLAGVNGPAMSAEAAARVAAGGGSFASALSSTSIAQAIERAIFDSNQRLGRTGQAVLQ